MSNDNNNSNNATVHSMGIMKMSFAPDGSEVSRELTREHSPSGQMTINPPTLRMNADGEASQAPAFVRHSTAEDRPKGAGILESAHNSWGSRATKLTSDTLVDIGSSTTTIAAAVKAGFLSVDSQGNYYEPQGQGQSVQQPSQSTAPSAQSQEQPQQQPVLEEYIQTAVSNAFHGVSPGQMLKVMETIGSKGIDAVDWQELSRATGNPAEDLRGLAGLVNHKLHEHAVKASGLPDEAFFQGMINWADEAAPKELDNARRMLIHGGDASGIKALAERYLKAVPPSASSLKELGHKTWTDRQGKEWIEISGQTLEVKTAARLGLIR